MTAVVAVMAIMDSVCIMRRPQLGAHTSHNHISNDAGTRAKAVLVNNRQHENGRTHEESIDVHIAC